MENIRTDIEYLDYKISCLDEDRIQAAWKRLQDHVKHLNHLLVTERMDRQKEREQAERIRKRWNKDSGRSAHNIRKNLR